MASTSLVLECLSSINFRSKCPLLRCATEKHQNYTQSQSNHQKGLLSDSESSQPHGPHAIIKKKGRKLPVPGLYVRCRSSSKYSLFFDPFPIGRLYPFKFLQRKIFNYTLKIRTRTLNNTLLLLVIFLSLETFETKYQG